MSVVEENEVRSEEDYILKRLPVVSYLWIFRTQTIRTQAQTFRTLFGSTQWTIRTQQFMTHLSYSTEKRD